MKKTAKRRSPHPMSRPENQYSRFPTNLVISEENPPPSKEKITTHPRTSPIVSVKIMAYWNLVKESLLKNDFLNMLIAAENMRLAMEAEIYYLFEAFEKEQDKALLEGNSSPRWESYVTFDSYKEDYYSDFLERRKTFNSDLSPEHLDFYEHICHFLLTRRLASHINIGNIAGEGLKKITQYICFTNFFIELFPISPQKNKKPEKPIKFTTTHKIQLDSFLTTGVQISNFHKETHMIISEINILEKRLIKIYNEKWFPSLNKDLLKKQKYLKDLHQQITEIYESASPKLENKSQEAPNEANSSTSSKIGLVTASPNNIPQNGLPLWTQRRANSQLQSKVLTHLNQALNDDDLKSHRYLRGNIASLFGYKPYTIRILKQRIQRVQNIRFLENERYHDLKLECGAVQKNMEGYKTILTSKFKSK